jgi:pilus assembly protein CpaC
MKLHTPLYLLLILATLVPGQGLVRAARAEDAPKQDAAAPAPKAGDEDDAEIQAAQILDDRAIPVKRKRRKKDPYRRSRMTTDEAEVRSDKRRLLLTTGEDKTIDLDFTPFADPDKSIVVGNPQVVGRTLITLGDKRQLVLKPLKSGETTVTVRDTEGNLRLVLSVRVTGNNLLRISGELRDLLRDIEGLEIRVVGPKVILEGELLVPTDYGRMVAVIQDRAYADYVMNLATLSPLAMQVLARRIQEDVNTFATNARTRVVNGVIFLEGTVDTIDQANRAAKIASLYLPEIRPGNQLERDPTAQRLPARPLVQNFLIINPPPPKKQEKLVRITIHFVELKKDYTKIFGFKWEPGFTADPQIQIGQNAAGTTAANSTSFSATLSSLIPQLKTAESAGYARVLRTGTVIVRSTQEAKLQEQVELPFPQLGPNGQVTAAKQGVGLDLTVRPLILGQSEDIQMDLIMDQITAGRSVAANLPPVVSRHRVETKLYVKSGESAAVAGVTDTDVGTNYNSDDPSQGGFDQSSTTSALFTLLRSKGYTKNRSQFVIFVTPQIVENASDGSEDLKKSFRVKVK